MGIKLNSGEFIIHAYLICHEIIAENIYISDIFSSILVPNLISFAKVNCSAI